MSSELTNLIPSIKKKQFRQTYFIRLAVVAIILAGVVVAIQGVMLFPSYLFERQAVLSAKERLAQVSVVSAGKANQSVPQQRAALKDETDILMSLASTPTASAALRAVIEVPRSGIVLNGFVFTPVTNGGAVTMAISGVADTREQLRSYNAALAALPFVSKADLPISAYAKESDISFVITLSGTFSP